MLSCRLSFLLFFFSSFALAQVQPDFTRFRGGGLGNAYVLPKGNFLIGAEVFTDLFIQKVHIETSNIEREFTFTERGFAEDLRIAYGLLRFLELGLEARHRSWDQRYRGSSYAELKIVGFYPQLRLNFSSGKEDSPVVTFLYQRNFSWWISESDQFTFSHHGFWQFQFSKSIFKNHLISAFMAYNSVYSHDFQYSWFPHESWSLNLSVLGTTQRKESFFDYRLGTEFRLNEKFTAYLNGSFGHEKLEYPQELQKHYDIFLQLGVNCFL
jgi:hypothetical protein